MDEHADDDRHVNPSGLPEKEKKPQPVPPEHHEEGHEDDPRAPE